MSPISAVRRRYRRILGHGRQFWTANRLPRPSRPR
jgi:hypothetical protein